MKYSYASNASFRYYRFYITGAKGDISHAAIDVFELTFQWGASWQTNAKTADASAGGGTIGGLACVTSASSTGNTVAWRAFDGNTGTAWESQYYGSSQGTNIDNYWVNQWLKVDFGANPQTITGMKILGSSTNNGNPIEFHLEGSTDNISWIPIIGSAYTAQNTSTERTYTWTWAN